MRAREAKAAAKAEQPDPPAPPPLVARHGGYVPRKRVAKRKRKPALLLPLREAGTDGPNNKKPPRFGPPSKELAIGQSKSQGKQKNEHLAAYEKAFLHPEKCEVHGAGKGEIAPAGATQDPVSSLGIDQSVGDWKESLPTPARLRCSGFGRPDRDHSATQTACGETVIFFLLKSGCLDEQSTAALCSTNPLVHHMRRSMIALEDYDFTWIRQYNNNWQSQSEIPPESKKAALACLYHYGMDVSLLIRYLGNNYTGEHRDVEETVAVLL